MTIHRQQTVICPSCGSKGRYDRYLSASAQDPEARARVLDGSVFQYACPYCGAVSPVESSLFYHDAERRLAVQYVAGDDDAEAFERMLAGLRRLMPAGDGWRVRSVASPGELIEKALIAEQGLDDRAVELLKALAAAELAQIKPGFAAEACFLDRGDGDGKLIFAFMDAAGAMLAMPFDSGLCASLAAGLAGSPDTERRVDAAWARAFWASRRP
ncbi:MAG: hypothetical protein HUK26_03740 [Duodenibacillus sp.]|nr:hypothetical protein [Duodenibacillus sp.]